MSKELTDRGYNITLKVNNTKDIRNYKVSGSKMEDVFGFKAKYNPADSVSEILSNLGENFDFNQDRFYNIKTFKTNY